MVMGVLRDFLWGFFGVLGFFGGYWLVGFLKLIYLF